MKIHDIILITSNVVNSNMKYIQTYVISFFIIQESFRLNEDPLTKSSTLNNTDTHK